MRNDLPYEYSYDEQRDAQNFAHTKHEVEAKFKKASTEAEKYALLLTDWRYAYFYDNPAAKTVKDLAWRFRQCYRTLQGKVPAHVSDAILSADPKYVGWFKELNVVQQYKVAKKDPLQVYRFPSLFKDEVLNKVHPGLKLLVETLGPMGFTPDEFKKQVKMALSKKTIEAAPLPDNGMTVNF